MKLFICVISIFIISCTPLHNIYKIQSDRRIEKTEDLNFTGEKALTQWWYYDCVFEDGSVLVILFTPYKWWDETVNYPANKSLFYLSYMKANGEVVTSQKTIDVSEIVYSNDSIKSPYFEIIRTHEKQNRSYTVNFFLDSINGSVKINAYEKAFSPFPRGSMSSTITQLFKKNAKGLAYRYSAHVTEGIVKCKIELKKMVIELSGKTYHEQGWFTGRPDQMGDGWVWFHFVSKSMNVFGTAGKFFCLEKNGKCIIGGLEKKCFFSEMTYSGTQKNLLIGGKLILNSKKLSFEISPVGKTSYTLICLPSVDTDQLWGTVLQESGIEYTSKKNVLIEDGVMFIETCIMNEGGNKINSNRPIKKK